MDPADSGTRVLVCGGSNRAGIQDYDLGVLRLVDPVQALVNELALNGCAVRLCRATAEVFHIKARHG
jgi:hypothetical protein